MLSTACTNEEKVKVTASPVTATGQPAALDDGLKAEVISGDGTFELNAGGDANSVYLISGSQVGQTVYRLFGDADLGDGTVVIEDSATLDVSGAQAVSFGLSASTPEPK